MKLSNHWCLAAAALLTVFAQAQTTIPAMRSWTSTDGHKIDALFVALEGEGVKIRMANGSTFTIPLERLSAADQAFAKGQAAPSPTAATATSGAPVASTTWPRTVSLGKR